MHIGVGLAFLLVTWAPDVIAEYALEDAAVTSGCRALAPGLRRMALGVDLTQLDLYHDYTKDSRDGFLDKIIEYTCAEGKTWESPYDQKTYQIPDQIDDFSSLSTGMVISKANVYSEKNEMKKEMAAEVGLGGQYDGFGFSSSLTYKSSFQSARTLETESGSNKALVTVSRATFVPARFIGNSSISKYFAAELLRLPPVFNKTTEERYFQLLRSYGTHFFHRANFGGTLSIWFEISKSLSRTMASKELDVQIQASFLIILKAHGAYNGKIAAVDERFSNASTHQERYFGGESNLFSSEGFLAWWPTVARKPWLHTGSLVPLTDLLSDWDPKKTQLVKATRVYLMKSYINEVERVIRLYQSFHGLYAKDKILVGFLNHLERLREDESPLDEVHTVDTLVQHYVITPKWFLSKVSLCWSASEQEKSCTHVGQTPVIPKINKDDDPLDVSWYHDGSLPDELFDYLKSHVRFVFTLKVSSFLLHAYLVSRD